MRTCRAESGDLRYTVTAAWCCSHVVAKCYYCHTGCVCAFPYARKASGAVRAGAGTGNTSCACDTYNDNNEIHNRQDDRVAQSKIRATVTPTSENLTQRFLGPVELIHTLERPKETLSSECRQLIRRCLKNCHWFTFFTLESELAAPGCYGLCTQLKQHF